MMRIEWSGETFLLSAEGAAFHPDSGTLFVADLHLGKTEAFRAAGVPLPSGADEATLRTLELLISRIQPKSIIMLGDLMHAPAGQTAATIASFTLFRQRHAGLPMHLVAGNHDRKVGDVPAAWDLPSCRRLLLGERLQCVHDPAETEEAPELPAIAGHLHPAVRIGTGDGGTHRFRCYWLQPKIMTLPAFGRFTGSALVAPGPEDRVVLAHVDHRSGESIVVEATRLVCRTRKRGHMGQSSRPAGGRRPIATDLTN